MSLSKQTFNLLLDLQEVDSQIDADKKELNNLPQKARYDEINQNLATIQKNYDIAKKTYEAKTSELNKVNGELDLLQQKIKKEENLLFGGTISNSKELSSLQQEIESLNRKRDEIETILLEKMDESTKFEALLQKADKQIETYSSQLAAAKEEWSQREEELRFDIEALSKKRQEIAKDIDPEWLSEYEDVRSRKGGIGAAALIEGVCQVCHVALPDTELEEIKGKEEPDYCSSCGRILVK